MTKPSIGIILPEVETWSGYYGGALARFVNETISRSPSDIFNFDIYCKSCHTEHAYPLSVIEPRFTKTTLWLDKKLTRIRVGFAGWAYILSLYPKFKKHDLIHVYNRPYYVFILRKLGYKGKIIIHLQNDFNKSSTAYAKRFIKSADLIVSCSQKIADRLFEKDPENSHKSRVIYNGSDEKKFTYTPLTNRKKQILFVGRIDEIKGIHNLLDAYFNISKKHPDWELSLAGSASFGDKKELTAYELSVKEKIQMINASGGKVNHLGYINHTDLPALFQESLIFCLPSIVHEAFGLVIVEAIFCGTPVVASDMGGIPEVVGENGLLCDTNAEALEKGFLKYIEQPELMEKHSLAALERAKKMFTWDSIAKQQFALYQKILNQK